MAYYCAGMRQREFFNHLQSTTRTPYGLIITKSSLFSILITAAGHHGLGKKENKSDNNSHFQLKTTVLNWFDQFVYSQTQSLENLNYNDETELKQQLNCYQNVLTAIPLITSWPYHGLKKDVGPQHSPQSASCEYYRSPGMFNVHQSESRAIFETLCYTLKERSAPDGKKFKLPVPTA